MDTSFKVGKQNIELLRAYPMKRWLPKLGSGLNMFESPMQAAGNVKLRMTADGAHLAVKA